MMRIWLDVAGLGGFLSVAAGAIAAHLAVGDAHAAELPHTGALYGMVHAAVLFALAGLAERRERPSLPLTVAAWSFAAGIALFSLSLFLVAVTGIAQIGQATPFGGAALLVGWAALCGDAARRR